MTYHLQEPPQVLYAAVAAAAAVAELHNQQPAVEIAYTAEPFAAAEQFAAVEQVAVEPIAVAVELLQVVVAVLIAVDEPIAVAVELAAVVVFAVAATAMPINDHKITKQLSIS